MSVPVDWEAAVARYNTHEREWDPILGPSPKEPGCRAPAHVLRAYGYDPVWGPTLLTPPIYLSQMDDWLRQVLADPKLPASAKNVAVSIALHLNREKGIAWPSVPRIANQTAVLPRTVYTALAALDGLHLIRHRGGGRASNRYSLVLWPVKPGAPANKISPVKPTSSTGEAGFISPVKDASPEPLTEPLIRPPNAQRVGEEVKQEKRKSRENHSIIRKDRETINDEVVKPLQTGGT